MKRREGLHCENGAYGPTDLKVMLFRCHQGGSEPGFGLLMSDAVTERSDAVHPFPVTGIDW